MHVPYACMASIWEACRFEPWSGPGQLFFIILTYLLGYLVIRFPWIWVDISYKLSFLCMPSCACIVCMLCHTDTVCMCNMWICKYTYMYGDIFVMYCICIYVYHTHTNFWPYFRFYYARTACYHNLCFTCILPVFKDLILWMTSYPQQLCPSKIFASMFYVCMAVFLYVWVCTYIHYSNKIILSGLKWLYILCNRVFYTWWSSNSQMLIY